MKQKVKTTRAVPAVIQFHLKDASVDASELIHLSVDLLQVGLIHIEPRELRFHSKTKEMVELVCTFVDEYAARSWRKDVLIKKRWHARFKKLLKGVPKVVSYRNVIDEPDKVYVDGEKVCACKTWPSLILFADPYGHKSSVVCGRCVWTIPAYKLTEVSLWDFEQAYHHVYWIWLNSGTLEMWAQKQIEDYHSDLNKEARNCVNRLKKQFKVPVYYRMWTDGLSGEDDVCPNCSSKGKESPWGSPSRVCNRCKLAFGALDC